jgi:hypothetical protein
MADTPDNTPKEEIKEAPAPRARPAGDFFGPYFKVKFFDPNPQAQVDANGQVVKQDDGSITLSPESQQKQETFDRLQSFVSNITITCPPGTAMLSLTMTPPYQDALDLLETHAFTYGQYVGVRWGYASDDLVSQEHIFLISQPKVTFGKDTIITISGVDSFSGSMRQRTTKSKWSRKVYNRDILLLTELAKRCNYKIDAQSKTAVIINSTDHPLNKIKTDESSPIEDAESDSALFSIICRGNNVGYVIKGDTISLYDRKASVREATSYNFFWYGQSESPNDIPMISFTTNPTDIIFAPAKEAESKLITHVDPDTGEVTYEVYEPSKDANNAAEGDPKKDGSVVGTSDKQNQAIKTETAEIKKPSFKDNKGNIISFGAHASVPHNANNGVEKQKEESKDVAQMVNTTATLVAPGHPDVMPPMNVNVRGVGIFSGSYYLLEAKHTIGTGGYEMQLELIRTTTPGGKVNQTNTQETPGSGSKNNTPDITTNPDDTSKSKKSGG